MKISHEVPIDLFNKSTGFNDYPYVLGHLIKQNSEYREFYKYQLKKTGFSILDNSAFELGKSIPFEELISVARNLRPTHLVLPDTVHNKSKTLNDSENFLIEFGTELKLLGITPMGVVQGDSFQELTDCITFYLKLGVSYIAIPFDCIKDTDYSIIRFLFFKKLKESIGVSLMKKLKFHFLGIENPQEMLLYSKEEKELITSIDSSSPILHGVCGNRFTQWGTNSPKPKIKLADNLELEFSKESLELVKNNINYFRKYCNE